MNVIPERIIFVSRGITVYVITYLQLIWAYLWRSYQAVNIVSESKPSSRTRIRMNESFRRSQVVFLPAPSTSNVICCDESNQQVCQSELARRRWTQLEYSLAYGQIAAQFVSICPSVSLLLSSITHCSQKKTTPTKYSYVWFTSPLRSLFWDLIQRRLVVSYLCFGTTCRSHLHGSDISSITSTAQLSTTHTVSTTTRYTK